jgi:hypothetical protein
VIPPSGEGSNFPHLQKNFSASAATIIRIPQLRPTQ